MHKRQPRRSILPMTNIYTADSWNKDRFYQTGFAFFMRLQSVTLRLHCKKHAGIFNKGHLCTIIY